LIVTLSGELYPNVLAVAVAAAGAASLRMNVVAEPLTALVPIVAVGLAALGTLTVIVPAEHEVPLPHSINPA